MRGAALLVLAVCVGAAAVYFIMAGKDNAMAADGRDQHGYLHIPAVEAAKLIETTPDLVILDVRTPGEFADGHLKGAVNIDFNDPDFAEKIATLDPAGNYLLHCRSGNRSGKAIPDLVAAGLTNVTHMQDGTLGWSAAKLPLVTP